MDDYLSLWQNIVEEIKENCDSSFFSDTFGKINKVFKVEKNYIYMIVPNQLIKYNIERFYLNQINDSIQKYSSLNVKFKMITEEDATKEEKEKKIEPLTSVTPHLSGRKISSIYTFNNFEVGESNRHAFISATKAAESVEKIYNPLYIFGSVGLGKTHLMTAIGNYILDNDLNTNVVYISSQKFAEEYFLATSSRRSKENDDNHIQKIEAFYNKYNTADVLLIDDIQFLEGKEVTQQEFFKIFEHLIGLNKQIVITSDKPAADLKNVMSRLKTRFSWGVTVNIKSPDKALRISILKSKLKYLIKDPSDVPDEVLDILADNFSSNIRVLEGALRNFVTYCTCFDSPFTKERLYESLDGLLPKDSKVTDSSLSIIDDVREAICEYYKISQSDLNSSSRKQQVAYARQMMMYILRTNFSIPLKTIGESVGGRDHATVAHAIGKIEFMLKDNNLAKSDLDLILKKLKKKS